MPAARRPRYNLDSDERQELADLLVEVLLIGSEGWAQVAERAGMEELSLTAFAGFPSQVAFVLERDLALRCPGQLREPVRGPLDAAQHRLKTFRRQLVVATAVNRRPRRRLSALAR